jgi:hypothetical protein
MARLSWNARRKARPRGLLESPLGQRFVNAWAHMIAPFASQPQYAERQRR